MHPDLTPDPGILQHQIQQAFGTARGGGTKTALWNQNVIVERKNIVDFLRDTTQVPEELLDEILSGRLQRPFGQGQRSR